MPYRKEARIPSALWDDPTFRTFSSETQWLYTALLTSPDMNSAGVLDLLPRRWAGRAAGADASAIVGYLRALHAEGFVCADEDTQEVFVSGYFETERIALQPRRVVGVIDTLNLVTSEEVKAFASAELSEQMAGATPRAPRGMRVVVLERDGWRCRRCEWRPGDPVPSKRGRPLYRGLEIDHIHPKSKGGPDTLDNFQVLCTSCNASKGARV